MADNPMGTAVRPDDPVLDFEAGVFIDRLLYGCELAFAVGGMNEFEDALIAQRVFRRQTEVSFALRAGFEQPALKIDFPGAEPGDVHRDLHAFGALAQLRFGLLTPLEVDDVVCNGHAWPSGAGKRLVDTQRHGPQCLRAFILPRRGADRHASRITRLL